MSNKTTVMAEDLLFLISPETIADFLNGQGYDVIPSNLGDIEAYVKNFCDEYGYELIKKDD